MSGAINQRMGAAEWAMLLALSVLWGGSFFFIGVAVEELPPLTIVALRVGLAALALWGFAFASGLRPPRAPAVWLAFLGMGVANNAIPFTLIVWGQTHIAAGLASILNATTPLFTVLIAGLLLSDERMTGRKAAGVAIGFGGVVVMIGPAALGQVGAHVPAQLAVLAAAFAYACAGVFGRRFRAMGVDPIVTAAGQVTASSAVLIPLSLVVDRPFALAAPSPGTWAAIVGLAILSTAVAYVLYFRLLASAGAVNLLLVTFLIPVSAILLGRVFLGERLEPVHFAGMALIGLGLSAIDGRLWRRRRPAAAAGNRAVD
jgi:drug/metabolite transporter (DMT)-like permease